MLMFIIVVMVGVISPINAAGIDIESNRVYYHIGSKHAQIKDSYANCYRGLTNVKCAHYGKSILPYYVTNNNAKYVKIKIGSKTIKRDAMCMFYAYSGNLKGKTIKITSYNKYNKILSSKTVKIKNIKTGYSYGAN